MSQYLNPRQFLRIAAVGFIVVIVVLAIVQSRRDNDVGIIPLLGYQEADALVPELARCRAVTLDQAASLETCRRLWAENRRQFFAPTKAPLAAAEPNPNPSTASGPSQHRVSPGVAERQHGDIR